MTTQDAGSGPHGGPRLRLVTCPEPAPPTAPTTPPPGAPAWRRVLRGLTHPAMDEAALLERALHGLGPRWRVLRQVPDTDAVIVGPGGVFALTGSAQPGACVAVLGDVVAVNGDRVPLVGAARAGAGRLTHLLARRTGGGIRVRGLVAITDARPTWALREQPADGAVVVLPGRSVWTFLTGQPQVLAPARVDAIARLLAQVSGERPTAASADRLGRAGIRAI